MPDFFAKITSVRNENSNLRTIINGVTFVTLKNLKKANLDKFYSPHAKNENVNFLAYI